HSLWSRITNGHRFRGLAVDVQHFLALVVFHKSPYAETNLPGLYIDLDDFGIEFLTDTDYLFWVCALLPTQFRQVDESFHAILKFGKRPKVGHFHDLHAYVLPDMVFCLHLRPRIELHLLQSEGQPLILFVHVQHNCPHLLALLQDFRGVLDALRPGHIGNVDETIDAFFESDKGPKVGQITNFAFDFTSHRVALIDGRPRVGLNLLHAQ